MKAEGVLTNVRCVKRQPTRRRRWFISAIGAIGGFFIPKAFGSSLALTGSPVGAMKVFLIFYIACVVITWAVYGRHSKNKS